MNVSLILFGIIILIIGVAKKERNLIIVGSVATGIALLEFLAVFTLFFTHQM